MTSSSNCTRDTDLIPSPMPTDSISPIIAMITVNATAALFRVYSPITLSQEWPKISRFLFMIFVTWFGTSVNSYFVASFFIHNTLKRAGNIFLSCTGVSDIAMTSVVTSVSAVVILSGQWDNPEVCKALHFIGLSSTYSFGIFFTFVAVENYYRISRSPDEYAEFLSMPIGLVCILIFGGSIGLAGVGVYMDLEFDYCGRMHYGNFLFRVATTILVQALPSILTLLFLIIAIVLIQRRARCFAHYRRSQLYESDFSITVINITVYLSFLLSWAPYVTIVYIYPESSDAAVYNMMAVGVFRSCLTSSLYGIFNRDFRESYGRIFNYFCCKNPLSSSFSHRHRRTGTYKRALGEVRVHIMHQAVTPSNRRVSYWRETRDL